MLKQLLFAVVAATITPGSWDLYSGTSKVSTHTTEAACVKAAKDRGISRNYTCRTRTGVLVSVTADPPPVVVPPPVVLPPPEPPATGLVYASPPNADASVLKAGETLVLRDGAYSSLKLKACTADAWCTVKAEHDGAAVVSSLNVGSGSWYTSVEGLKFKSSSAKVVLGSYLKFRRVAFEGGPSSGNDVSLQIGSSEVSPKAVLIEDSWVYGLGGRYKALVYNADGVVLRRLVVRHDGGWAYDSRNPQGGYSLYDSRNVVCEDCLFVDPAASLNGFEAALYLVSNGTTPIKQSNISVIGAVLQGSPNNGLAAEGNGSAATYYVSDVLVTGSKAGGFNTNNSGHQLNLSRVQAKVTGYQFAKWASGGALNVNGCATGSGPLNSGASLQACPGGEGPRLAFRVGVDGTLFGEAGYDTVTNVPLFPWPNEDRIKADFESVRPFCGGKSVTECVK